MALKRALNANDIRKCNDRPLGFEGEFRDAFGDVAVNAVWLLWGQSGMGKSTMAMILAKYLTQFTNQYGRVHYASMEENVKSSTFKNRVIEFDLPKSFQAANESLEDLRERLSRRKSAHFVIIDSADKALRPYKQTERLAVIEKFVDDFAHKHIIIIGRASGNKPNALAAEIEYMAGIKVQVKWGLALAKSRYAVKGGSGKLEVRRELMDSVSNISVKPAQPNKPKKKQADESKEPD